MKCFLLFISLPLLSYGQVSLKQTMKNQGIKSSEIVIKIDKSERTMEVVHDDVVLKTYPCVLGFNPIDDKKQEGDGCTPEGDFGIRSMYAHKSWDYFIWIDYPNKESWKKFNARKSKGEIGEKATIGGEIGIHGVPENSDELVDKKVDWTLGCISLKEADIKDLYEAISKETTINIQP